MGKAGIIKRPQDAGSFIFTFYWSLFLSDIRAVGTLSGFLLEDLPHSGKEKWEGSIPPEGILSLLLDRDQDLVTPNLGEARK